MPFNAPTAFPAMSPDVWARRQEAGTHAEGYNPELSAQIQQLPSYQAWVRSLQKPGLHATGQGVGGTTEWKALIADLERQGIHIPENEVLDSDSGTVRGKTWMERHPVLSGVLITAGFAGGGAALGAALGGGAAAAGAAGAGSSAGGAAGTGAGAGTAAAGTGAAGAGALGPTTAGTMAATDIAAAGGPGTMLAGATVPASLGGAGAMPVVGSTLGTIGKIAKAGSDLAAAGKPISDASTAAANQRYNQANFDISAQRSYETALMDRAKEEATQRNQAQKDIYRSSYFKNEKPGPYDTRGLAAVSPEYLSSLADLEKQGVARLKVAPEYDTTKLQPLVTAKAKPAGTLEQVGSTLGPTLSTIGTIAKLYGDFRG